MPLVDLTHSDFILDTVHTCMHMSQLMKIMGELYFGAQDKLPTVYAVAITIFSHATRLYSQIMKDVVHKYSNI